MAKFEILSSEQKPAASQTPSISGLALPLSLATQQGAAISTVGAAIADIQKDMYAIEDQNNYNKVLPGLSLEIQKKYDAYSKSLDTKAPNKLIVDLQPSNFNKYLEGQSGPVQKLLKNQIASQASLLVPKLNSQVVSNNLEAFTSDLDQTFDKYISLMMSSDQTEIGIGEIGFDNLIKNEAYKGYLGAKEWENLTKKKQSLKNKLLLSKELQINPKSAIENKQALIDLVGVDVAKEYIQEARTTLNSNRELIERKDRMAEIASENSQVVVFSSVLVRINNAQKNIGDEQIQNELPTIGEIYKIYEAGLINEAMFIKLTDFLSEEEQDGMSNDELFTEVQIQISSAKTIQMLDDIKKSYLLQSDKLGNLSLDDVFMFNNIIEKGQKNYTAHKDYQTYQKMIEKNIANMTTTNSRNAQRVFKSIADQRQLILKSYNRLVSDGMKPEQAYLNILDKDFDRDFLPVLEDLPFPTRIENWEKSLTEKDFFKNQSQLALENYKKTNQGVFEAKRLMDDLDRIKFAQDIYNIRYSAMPGDAQAKFKFAIEGAQRKTQSAIDSINVD